jgi:hypothetical protein
MCTANAVMCTLGAPDNVKARCTHDAKLVSAATIPTGAVIRSFKRLGLASPQRRLRTRGRFAVPPNYALKLSGAPECSRREKRS